RDCDCAAVVVLAATRSPVAVAARGALQRGGRPRLGADTAQRVCRGDAFPSRAAARTSADAAATFRRTSRTRGTAATGDGTPQARDVLGGRAGRRHPGGWSRRLATVYHGPACNAAGVRCAWTTRSNNHC